MSVVVPQIWTRTIKKIVSGIGPVCFETRLQNNLRVVRDTAPVIVNPRASEGSFLTISEAAWVIQ